MAQTNYQDDPGLGLAEGEKALAIVMGLGGAIFIASTLLVLSSHYKSQEQIKPKTEYTGVYQHKIGDNAPVAQNFNNQTLEGKLTN